jgi:uncharacterized protein (DUF362 family)
VTANPVIDLLKRLMARFALRGSSGAITDMGLHRAFNGEAWQTQTFIAKADSYEGDLASVVSSGMEQLGVTRAEVEGKTILLKPNLVETSSVKSACINTHPSVMRAAVVAFQRLGAARVLIGEGAGHRRDSMILLEQSGLIDVLKETGATFVDLNYAEVVAAPNAGRISRLKRFMLPRVVREADWVVSMAKLKTHHWAGVTLAMKNLYGVVPGAYYGWPKNVLHHVGLQQSIYDVAATVNAHFAIVDGIIGMEGDGPILGEAKPAGVLVMGRNLPAVDATCSRVMGIDPVWIPYLAASPYFLGPIHEDEIEQRGERIDAVKTEFRLLEHIHVHRYLMGRRRTKTAAGGKETYGMFTY